MVLKLIDAVAAELEPDSRFGGASSRSKSEPAMQAGYDTDFYAWTQDQAKRLREGDFRRLDIDNLVDEIETLGRSVKREIESRLNVLIVHLLKWRFQAERRSRSWKATIAEQRKRLARELNDNPSLRSYPATLLAEEYHSARLNASGETDLPEDTFPTSCPFTVEQILDPDFFPEA